MATDFLERCDAIEECYEFMLAYAGQGLPTDQGSQSGGQVREFLQRGYNGTSLLHITRQVGGSRRAIYEEFGDKRGCSRRRCRRCAGAGPAPQTRPGPSSYPPSRPCGYSASGC